MPLSSSCLGAINNMVLYDDTVWLNVRQMRLGTHLINIYKLVWFFLGATTFSITTFSIMTLSIMTLSIMTLSRMGLFVTHSIIDTLHKWHSAYKPSTIVLNVITQSVILLSAVMLNVVAPVSVQAPDWIRTLNHNRTRQMFYHCATVSGKAWKRVKILNIIRKDCFQNIYKFITEDHFVKHMNITIH